MVGSRILRELIVRKHQVTAVVRNPVDVSEPEATVLQGDVFEESSVMATAKGMEAAISAYGPGHTRAEALLLPTRTLLAGLQKVGVQRFLMVGGAGSLEVAPGVRLVDTPTFPAEWKPIALAHAEALAKLQASNLDWTSVSPSAFLQPGQRTGTFRLGKDSLLTKWRRRK